MSFIETMQNVSNVLGELRDSQLNIDKTIEKGRTDPIEEEKVSKLHKTLDDLTDKKLEARKVPTASLSGYAKKYYGIEDFLRGKCGDQMTTTIFRTKANSSEFESNFADKIQQTLQTCCIMRQIASNVTISGEYFEGVFYPTPITTNWSSQGTTVAIAAQNFTKKLIQVFDLTAQPQVTARMMADVQIDLEEFVLERLAQMFAYQESNAFLNGDGNTMPRGILNYPATGTAPIINRITCASGNITAAGLMNLYYSLTDLYSQNASFIMHKQSVYTIRTLQNPNGTYLWLPGVLSGKSDTLLGCPLYTSNYIPTAAIGNDVIIFGDIKQAYQVVDRGDIQIVRDPFSNKPMVGFYATKRVGGDVINPNAINIMRIAA